MSELVQFCRSIAPELARAPLYVIESDGLPADLAETVSACGFLGGTAPRLDLTFRDAIADWQGRGVAVVLNCPGIRDEAERVTGTATDQAIAVVKRRVLIHELGHVLGERQPPYFAAVESPPPPDIAGAMGAARAALVADYSNPELPPWHDHGTDWLRATLHLAERARSRGLEFSTRDLIADYVPIPADAYAFEFELVEEFFESSNEDYEQVKRRPLPARFAHLHRAGVVRWYQEKQIVADYRKAVA